MPHAIEVDDRINFDSFDYTNPKTILNEDYSDLEAEPISTRSCWRNSISFFVFGLVNNVIYVIFLSAAEDLLRDEPNVRKSTVLLANILPAILVKLVAPYLIRILEYRTSVHLCLTAFIVSLLTVAFSNSLYTRFCGIILASGASGLGESSFLALTSYYGPSTIVAWSSGTGAAGIVGAFYYLAFGTWMEFSLKDTLLIATGLFPLLTLLFYNFLLEKKRDSYFSVRNGPNSESFTRATRSRGESESSSLMIALLLKFILPIFLVYFAEYVINNSVFFSLLFPLDQTPFYQLREHYPTYSAIYQTGVFIGRTFGATLIPFKSTWWFALLQLTMLLVMSAETILMFIGNIYVVFVLILLEGFFGGSAYVNNFCNISQSVPSKDLEFSMAFTGIADSTGIGLAGLFCLIYEPFLCRRNPICDKQILQDSL